MKCLNFLFFLFFTSFLLASQDRLEITSEYFDFDQKSLFYRVSNNVHIRMSRHRHIYDLRSELLEFDQARGLLSFKESLSLQYEYYQMYFSSFDYDHNEKKGFGRDYFLSLDPWQLKAKSFNIEPKELRLLSTQFSTCHGYEHYFLQSEKITFYPYFNFVVLNYNTLHFAGLPFKIPLPILFFSLDGEHNATLFPELGRSKLEGNYFRQGIPYYLNYKSSGYVQPGLSSEVGFIFRIANGLRLSPRHLIDSELSYYSRRALSGRFQYRFLNQDLFVINPLDMFFIDPYSGGFKQTLAFSYEHLMIENDEWVSKRPYITLDSSYQEKEERVYDLIGHLGYGIFSEEKGLQDIETFSFLHKLNYEIVNRPFRVNALLDHRYFHFVGLPYWNRLIFQLLYRFDRLWLKPEFTATSLLIHKGSSPFAFQNTYAIRENEVGLKLTVPVGKFEVLFEGDYQLRSQTYRRLQYRFDYTFHCWKLGLSWDEVRNIFSLSVNLI